MNLNEWAIKWGIPFEAVEDLRRGMAGENTVNVIKYNESEAAVQAKVRMEASDKGKWLMRNNVGAYDARKPPSPGTRWGLCNDSKEMNKIIKSSDLIGINPILIEQRHVGTIVGQFLAREIKPSNWTYSATEHELAQRAFHERVWSLGGDAQFANKTGTL